VKIFSSVLTGKINWLEIFHLNANWLFSKILPEVNW